MRISIITTFLTLIYSISYSQGLELNAAAFDSLPAWEPEEEFGYTSKPMPSKISYRKYAPNIQNQGNESTCVGFSVAYSQLTTQQNLNMGITNSLQKFVRSMDPYFIYSFIRNLDDSWCKQGTIMNLGMEVLKQYGCKPLIWEPWLKCNSTKKTTADFPLAVASMYKIDNYYKIPLNENFIYNIKNALKNRLIVSVGMTLTESFISGNALKYGDWTPNNYDKKLGGHAMCVVGFDTYRNGGSFEVMNSYGSKYGDDGYVWIKYADFKKFVKEAYIIETKGYSRKNCSFGDCYSFFSRYTFKNGDIYEGAVKKGLPNIYGSYLYSNGDLYIGDYLNGRKHGYGLCLISETGKYYKTYFENDVLINSTDKFGFAAKEKDEKINALFDKINNGKQGELVSPDDTEYENFFKTLEVPEKPLMLK